MTQLEIDIRNLAVAELQKTECTPDDLVEICAAMTEAASYMWSIHVNASKPTKPEFTKFLEELCVTFSQTIREKCQLQEIKNGL